MRNLCGNAVLKPPVVFPLYFYLCLYPTHISTFCDKQYNSLPILSLRGVKRRSNLCCIVIPAEFIPKGAGIYPCTFLDTRLHGYNTEDCFTEFMMSEVEVFAMTLHRYLLQAYRFFASKELIK